MIFSKVKSILTIRNKNTTEFSRVRNKNSDIYKNKFSNNTQLSHYQFYIIALSRNYTL